MTKKRKKNKKPKPIENIGQAPDDIKNEIPTPINVTWFDKLLQPHITFSILAFVFGTSFLITTPPFQVPDEIAHFDRVYMLAEFATFQKNENNISGDYLPTSIDSVFQMFSYLRWGSKTKVDKQRIFNALKIPLEKSKTEFTNIDAGPYFYFSYIPQLPVVFTGKLLNINPLYILYLGRFIALLFFIVSVRYAIKTIPIAKHLLLTIALMPICLAQAGSYSADCVLFSLSFIYVALVINLSYKKDNLAINKETILLFGILILLGGLKPIYFPMALLILVIFYRSFKNNYRYYLIAGLTIIIATTLFFGSMNVRTGSAFGFLTGNNRAQLLFENPAMFLDILEQTLNYFQGFYYKSTIGILGYLDTVLPKFIYSTFTFLIILLILFESNKKYSIAIFQRFIFFSVSTSVFLLTILVTWLFVTREEAGLIAEGVQGRYFIPVLLPFFIGFYGFSPVEINLSNPNQKILAATVYLALAILLFGTELTLIERYYG